MPSSSTATGRRLPITLVATMVVTLLVAGVARAVGGSDAEAQSGSTTTVSTTTVSTPTLLTPPQQCRGVLLEPQNLKFVDVTKSPGVTRFDLVSKAGGPCSFCVQPPPNTSSSKVEGENLKVSSPGSGIVIRSSSIGVVVEITLDAQSGSKDKSSERKTETISVDQPIDCPPGATVPGATVAPGHTDTKSGGSTVTSEDPGSTGSSRTGSSAPPNDAGKTGDPSKPATTTTSTVSPKKP